MESALPELKKVVAAIEAAPGRSTDAAEIDLALAADIVATCGRILASAAPSPDVPSPLYAKWWKKVVGHILCAIGEWLINS